MSSETRPILVVDDVRASLIAVEAALAPMGRPIVTASSGQQALARLLETDFALVLLDVQMPVMDGYETARWIRSRPRSEHLPIIFITGYSHDDADVLRAYELGAVDFLFKPVVPAVLRAKASVFVALQTHAEQLAIERVEHEFENRRRDYETAALRRERDREHEAKQALAQLNAALAESDQRKDSFIAILAHELRNPLAPIRTCIDLAGATPELPLTPQMLGVLDRQTRALARLVDDLLDLSRIKANKIELRPERVELVEVIEHAISTSKPGLDSRGHALVCETPSEPIPIIADAVRLAQVISNLLNNAARYTPREGRIEIACGVTGDRSYVRISDNGIGIEPELQKSIFEMFVQERVSSDGSGGLGLGLALAHRLVDLHHGTLAVESPGRGKGSTFTVTMPLATASDALVAKRRTEEMAPLAAPIAAGPVRTVVVDDNEDARELLSALLRQKGYDVLTANDGPSGLEIIRAHDPHVALVDLGLPGLDGLGVVAALRTQFPQLQTRLIALTGYGGEGDHERTTAAGFHAHLVKPASAAAIFACINDQLAKR